MAAAAGIRQGTCDAAAASSGSESVPWLAAACGGGSRAACRSRHSSGSGCHLLRSRCTPRPHLGCPAPPQTPVGWLARQQGRSRRRERATPVPCACRSRASAAPPEAAPPAAPAGLPACGPRPCDSSPRAWPAPLSCRTNAEGREGEATGARQAAGVAAAAAAAHPVCRSWLMVTSCRLCCIPHGCGAAGACKGGGAVSQGARRHGWESGMPGRPPTCSHTPLRASDTRPPRCSCCQAASAVALAAATRWRAERRAARWRIVQDGWAVVNWAGVYRFGANIPTTLTCRAGRLLSLPRLCRQSRIRPMSPKHPAAGS